MGDAKRKIEAINAVTAPPLRRCLAVMMVPVMVMEPCECGAVVSSPIPHGLSPNDVQTPGAEFPPSPCPRCRRQLVACAPLVDVPKPRLVG